MRLALALVGAAAVAGSPAIVIRSDDHVGSFAVKGDGTLAGLIRTFGRPATLRRIETGCLGRWPRIGLTVSLYNLGTSGGLCKFFHDAVLIGRGWRTANGLRIGDRLATMRQLFPRARRTSDWWVLIDRYYAGYSYAGLAAKIVHDRVSALRLEYPAGGT